MIGQMVPGYVFRLSDLNKLSARLSLARSLARLSARTLITWRTHVTGVWSQRGQRQLVAAADNRLHHRRPGNSNFEYDLPNIIVVSISLATCEIRPAKRDFNPVVGNVRASSRGACKWLGLALRLIELINRFRLKRECGQSSQYTLTRFENEAFRLSSLKKVRWNCWTYCISTRIFRLT